MSLLAKFESIARVSEELARYGSSPVGLPMAEIITPTRAVIDGREVILAGTNNYLGLTFDEDCIRAACDALMAEGTGTTGSRMANGTYDSHLALEREIADFYDVPNAIVFTTGYQANLGTISTLAGPDEIIIIDADAHASIYDATRLSGAQTFRFKHNEPDDLAKRLRRLGDEARHALVVVEGIYSMLGDKAPLTEITAAVKESGAWLLIDEAHSVGVLGEKGRGLAEELGLLDQMDFITGTFSKSLGNVGGYCVSRHHELEWVRRAIRAYIFTASPTPATVAATRVALKKLRDEPERRRILWEHARVLHTALQSYGLRVGAEISPVVPVMMDSRQETLRAWQLLLEQGVYVNLVVPPAANLNLLRCSLSASHTEEDIERIIAAYGHVAAHLKPASQGESPGAVAHN